jgi:hypothetical protein
VCALPAECAGGAGVLVSGMSRTSLPLVFPWFPFRWRGAGVWVGWGVGMLLGPEGTGTPRSASLSGVGVGWWFLWTVRVLPAIPVLPAHFLVWVPVSWFCRVRGSRWGWVGVCLVVGWGAWVVRGVFVNWIVDASIFDLFDRVCGRCGSCCGVVVCFRTLSVCASARVRAWWVRGPV